MNDANRYLFNNQGKGRLEGVYIAPHTQSDHHIVWMLVKRIPYESAERIKEAHLIIFASEGEGSHLHRDYEEIWARIEEYEDENGGSRKNLVVDNTHYQGIPYSKKYPYTELVWCDNYMYTSTGQWSQKLKGKNLDGPWKECQHINLFATPYHNP